MKATSKNILLNFIILTVVLIFRQSISDHMQHFMVIFSVAIVYPFLSSIIQYFDKIQLYSITSLQ